MVQGNKKCAFVAHCGIELPWLSCMDLSGSRPWLCMCSLELAWHFMACYGLKWHFMVFYGIISSSLAVIDPNSFGLVTLNFERFFKVHQANRWNCMVGSLGQSPAKQEHAKPTAHSYSYPAMHMGIAWRPGRQNSNALWYRELDGVYSMYRYFLFFPNHSTICPVFFLNIPLCCVKCVRPADCLLSLRMFWLATYN